MLTVADGREGGGGGSLLLSAETPEFRQKLLFQINFFDNKTPIFSILASSLFSFPCLRPYSITRWTLRSSKTSLP